MNRKDTELNGVCLVQYLDHTVVPVLRAALKELVMKR